MSKKLSIYRAYVSRSKKTSPMDVAKAFGVTREYVHQVVQEIRTGSEVQLTECMKNHKLQCLWQSKYLPWYEAIKHFRGNKEMTADFKYMLHQMIKDGYTKADIARFTKRDHSTIRHHLKKK